MKKMTFLTVVVVAVVAAGLVSCKYIRGQILDGPGMERDSTEILADEREMEAIKAYVVKFYQEWEGEDVLNYDYAKQHITPGLLKYLADAYEFECEGECLATWKFFYEGGGDVGEFKSRQITARDRNHVLVENKYVNYEYDVLLSVVKDGDTFKIDGLKQEKSAYIEN